MYPVTRLSLPLPGPGPSASKTHAVQSKSFLAVNAGALVYLSPQRPNREAFIKTKDMDGFKGMPLPSKMKKQQSYPPKPQNAFSYFFSHERTRE